MAHVIRDKKKFLNRVRRIKGQVDAIERALEESAECSHILHSVAACRGAIDGLMSEVIEGHIRFHVVDPDHNPASCSSGGSRVDRCDHAAYSGPRRISRSQRIPAQSLRPLRT